MVDYLSQFKVRAVKHAVALAMGKTVSLGGFTQEEIEEATKLFRSEGWKTVMSEFDSFGTSISHTSIKFGEFFAIKHTIDLIGEDFPNEPRVHYVHVRLVPVKELYSYFSDQLPCDEEVEKKRLRMTAMYGGCR